ncbi:transcription factor SRM1-like [Malania oleifera]|uniref:transcription factor SRM1-like n=1 Tax=Malania oleifera TaxID=397392 RepID=UPI0025AE736E|nr:transcription factor SRM1-like [Malania oleifera]
MFGSRDMWGTPGGDSPGWSRLQDKLFERALVMFPEGTPDRWEKIAGEVGKPVGEVWRHYEDLVHDVEDIDSGRVELPSYPDDSGSAASGSGSRARQGESERKKGIPWTEEEHRLFLIGLQKYGKGDWRSISRNAVVTRTPTQVASHAQKYFLRLNSVKKEKKRSSIHDITAVDDPMPQTGGSVQSGQFVSGQPVMGSMALPPHFHGGGSSGYHPFGFPM